MPGAGTAGEKHILVVEGTVDFNTKRIVQEYANPQPIVTGLKCNIVLAGTVECLENIDNGQCPFGTCRMQVNDRCATVYKKKMC